MKGQGKGKAKSKVTPSGKDGEGRKRPLLSRIPDWAILLLFCLLFLTQTILSIREKSATFDETAHLPAGYLSLKFGDYSFNPSHPPFVKMLAAVPLLFVEVKMPSPRKPFIDFTEAYQFLYEENDADRLLSLGRVAVLPLALLLGAVVYVWTKQLFGREAALFSLFLYSFEPNILAHAPLVNTDFGAACFMFLAIYAFYRLVQQVSIPHLLFAGLSLGLALTTKFSSFTLLPIFLLLGIGVIVTRHPIELRLNRISATPVAGRIRKLLILLAAMIGMALVAYVTIWAAYRFRYEGITLPGQTYQVTWDQVSFKQLWLKQVILWMKETKLLPEAYLFGFSIVPPSLQRLTFIMGELSLEGRWYYFIVTFVLKTPVPLMLFLLVTLFALRPLWRKDLVAILCLLGPVLVYFGIASAARINIGHRHILPIYPFLFVLAGSVVPWVRQQRALVKGGLAVLATWYLVSSIAIFPHYLAYFNELAGGPQNGYKYLVDSNLDWGQDLKGLKRYMDEHGIQRVWLSYFGTASPDYYKITYNYMPSYVIFRPNMEIEPSLYAAISASMLQGGYVVPFGLSPDYFAGFKEMQPIAKIGYSIFLYRTD